MQAKSRISPTKGSRRDILIRGFLRRGEFGSVDELAAKVRTFITDYNHKAKPFRWTYEGRPLKAA
jgi:hypothetical protein